MSENSEAEKGGSTGLFDELQHEVSQEAQPMLTFIIKNYKQILMAVGALVVVIAAYGIYDYSAKSSLQAARAELGDIIVNKDGAERLTALEAFVAKAPEEVRSAALFEMVRLQSEAGDADKVLAAWERLSGVLTGDMALVARLGKAQALATAGKAEDALAVMEGVESSAPESFKTYATLQLALVAEQAGKLDRALAAYEGLLAESANADKEHFSRKITALKARIAAKG